MPDAANREDMRKDDAGGLFLLRRFLLRTPLALPLAGCVSALLGGSGWVVLMVVGALAAAMRLWRILLCTLLCALIAALHAGLCRREAARLSAHCLQQETVELEGTVVDRLSRGCLLQVKGQGGTVALHGEEVSTYEEGDVVRVLAEPRELQRTPITGMFDRSAWMRSRGIALEADVIRGERLGHPISRACLRGWATLTRHALAERLMPPGTEGDPRRQVLCALVLGARELAEPSTMLPFRRGGTLHAFAVSGMHVVLLAGLLGLLLKFLRIHPVAGRWVLLLLLGCYVVVTGFSVPAQRAYLMLATLLVGTMLRRRVGLANSWCFAALLLLLVEPWQLYSAGFLLSFGIYAAICIGVRVCMNEGAWFGPDALIPPRLYTWWERRCWLADATVRGVVLVSLVAYVISIPLTCLLFHTVNLWGFVSNIVIAPLIPLVMLAGVVLLVVADIPVIGAAATWCALRASGALLAVSTSLAYLPGAYLATEAPRPPQSAMVLGIGYGGSVCVLGNPGLVIDCGNELSAALKVEPALFHAGYQPSALLLSQPVKSRSGGAEVLRSTWPKLRLIHARELASQPLRLSGASGSFTFYPPPPQLPMRPAANAAPIVLWEMPDGRRLLCIGEASRATWETLPPEARHADILLLGMNPNQSLDDPAVLHEIGACKVFLLPSAAGSQLQQHHLPPGGSLLRIKDGQCLPLF